MPSITFERSATRLLLAVALAAAAITSGGGALAAPPAPATDPEIAALFEEGRRLMTNGDHWAALANFKAIVARGRFVGALLNLGECYAKTGQTASAWNAFREAAAAAAETNDQERRAVAEEHVARLEPNLTRLTIRVDDPSQELEITRDGEPVARSAIGVAEPVDPGPHRIAATARSARPFSQTLDVRGAGATVVIPRLEDASSPPPQGVTVAAREDRSTGSHQRTLGLVVGGIGAAALAFGGVAGLLASSSRDEAKSHCTSYPDHCSPDGSATSPNETAQTWAGISTVAFVLGGLGLASGAVLYLTAPTPSSKALLRVRPAASAKSASVTLGGTW